MLVEMRITDVSGFDVSNLNCYRWHPGQERIDLSRCGLQWHAMPGLLRASWALGHCSEQKVS
jgi:hypothetical protein